MKNPPTSETLAVSVALDRLEERSVTAVHVLRETLARSGVRRAGLDADDCLQEIRFATWLAASRTPQSEIRSLDAWIFGIARRVARALAPGGRWLSLSGSTEGPAREYGPPRRSARDIVEAIEPALELLELRATEFHVPGPARAWSVLSRLRSDPVHPSTRSG